jgi:predicted ArsR family transcriptional regulator
VNVSEVADQVGVHPNTARFLHLETLADDGVVERVSQSSGPGRPRVGYRAYSGLARGGVRR